MRGKGNKILGIISAVTMLGGTIAFAGCSGEVYKGESLSAGYVSNAEVTSNGGFAVEKGDFVYFINGKEEYTAENVYGEVVRGALMRISKEQLQKGEYDKAQIVVPSVLSTQNYSSGIYIYGDYVYYATPTTDEDVDGVVQNSSLDFKRSKIDGTEAPMDGYFFRLSSNTVNYRFVQAGVDRDGDGQKDVFCLYEDDGALKSYNTATGENMTLVTGATVYYDQSDLENPNVYYTMNVTYNIEDSAIAHTPGYNQIYCVNAAARATVNADEASYTVEGGKTYDFDKAVMEKANEEAEEAQDNGEDVEIPYDFEDYSTYPYVNLGKLVLDGVGSQKVASLQPDTRFNQDDAKDAGEPFGYTYTIARYENGGVYFTRAANGSETKLYYMTDNRKSTLNTVTANNFGENVDVDLIANDTTKASGSAIFQLATGDNGARTHTYIYLSGSEIWRATVGANAETTEVRVASSAAGTLWQTRGEYLYYYGTGTNGYNLSRVNYTGDEEDYNAISMLETDEYKPITVALVDWHNDWYKPEFIGGTDVVLYCNAQSYAGGDVSYNYIYAAKVGTTEEIKANNELYDAVKEYLDEYSTNETATKLIEYYFQTEGGVSKEVEELYDKDFFKEVVEKFGKDGELVKESKLIALVGKMSDAHAEEIDTLWTEYLLQPEEEAAEEETGMPGWAIVLIVVGSVLVVAVALGIPAYRAHQKKVEAKREAEATVNAYKRQRIDTTDDKSIDVYADEDEETKDEE
ncbi:MAG: hypothetical protein IJF44_04210 [Clostridia bacterium]|nr:hypothetical protein [Clostridia bacterium]